MTTKKTPKTLDEARAEAAAAAAALAEAEAKAQAEERTHALLAERAAKGKRVLAVFDDVEHALTVRANDAAKERDAAVSALDLQAMIDKETAYHAAIFASNLWRSRFNSALVALHATGDLDRRTGPSEKPERRDRPVSIFAPGDTSAALLTKAIWARAHSLADSVLAEVLAEHGHADLAEEV